jgi:hypothetical protein
MPIDVCWRIGSEAAMRVPDNPKHYRSRGKEAEGCLACFFSLPTPVGRIKRLSPA